jgi:hypothetical protein
MRSRPHSSRPPWPFAALALPWPASLIASLILWTIVTALAITEAYVLARKLVAGDVAALQVPR